jgi:hypothetical protein
MANDLTIVNWANDIGQELAPAQRGRAVADYALVALAGVQIVNRAALGYVPAYRSFVDGARSTALEKVKPDGGLIEFEFEIPEIDAYLLRWIADELDRRSPFVSGDYQHGHVVLADGKVFDVNGPIPEAKEFVFTNTEPYARKLEIGVTESGRAFVVQVQPRIYERTAQATQAVFADRRVSITSEFRPIDAGAIKSWSGSPGAHRLARRRGGNPKLHPDWLTRQPAIIVRAT